MGQSDPRRQEGVQTQERTELKPPPLWRVVLHNDDYTTMEFVVWVLQSVFYMPEEQAIQVMLNVHVRGVGVAGVYTHEVAGMKVEKTITLAHEHEFGHCYSRGTKSAQCPHGIV